MQNEFCDYAAVNDWKSDVSVKTKSKGPIIIEKQLLARVSTASSKMEDWGKSFEFLILFNY